MRLLVTLVLLAAAIPAAAVQLAFPGSDAGPALVQKLGDESVCGLPSFPRRRACYVSFGDFSAWIYFGSDARTVSSISLAHGIGKKDRSGVRPEYRWVDLDAQGRVTKAVTRDARYSERSLSDDKAALEIARALSAFRTDAIRERLERYCSAAGDYEDHMMGCCDGLKEQRVSNDAYKCAAPGEPVEIEPQYRSMPPER